MLRRARQLLQGGTRFYRPHEDQIEATNAFRDAVRCPILSRHNEAQVGRLFEGLSRTQWQRVRGEIIQRREQKNYADISVKTFVQQLRVGSVIPQNAQHGLGLPSSTDAAAGGSWFDTDVSIPTDHLRQLHAQLRRRQQLEPQNKDVYRDVSLAVQCPLWIREPQIVEWSPWLKLRRGAIRCTINESSLLNDVGAVVKPGEPLVHVALLDPAQLEAFLHECPPRVMKKQSPMGVHQVFRDGAWKSSQSGAFHANLDRCTHELELHGYPTLWIHLRDVIGCGLTPSEDLYISPDDDASHAQVHDLFAHWAPPLPLFVQRPRAGQESYPKKGIVWVTEPQGVATVVYNVSHILV